MRKIILITVFLFLTTLTVTILYFSKIKLPGQNTTKVIDQIPQDAALVFEFKNDPQFYSLFEGSSLLTSFIGQKKAQELEYLHKNLIKLTGRHTAFTNQSIFISLHPEINSSSIAMLLTTNADGMADLQKTLETAIGQTNGALETEKIGNKTIGIITFPALKEAFYLTNNADVLAGSFSKTLLLKFLDERSENKVSNLAQLSDQQNKNSIADLYVNYQQFPVLFEQLFKYRNDDFFRFLNNLPASAALSLNYKSDALLFNGYTQTDTSAANYLNVFLNQQPIKNTLKEVYPENTASAVSFAFGQPAVFLRAVNRWQVHLQADQKLKALFNQIKRETGVAIQQAFFKQLGKEFTVITTAETEKIALIKVKNGSELEPYLNNISIEPGSLQPRLKYPDLLYNLLGEPFLHFKQPYYTLIDNYLVVANSSAALNRYLESYHQQRFLSKDGQYYNFDALLAEKSNVSFFIYLPHAYVQLENMIRPEFVRSFNQKTSGWKTYYAAALQFTASQENFYTNFYLQQIIPKPTKVDSLTPN